MALESVSIVSTDDPWKRGGAGGKTTHIRLLMKGLSAAGVSPELVCARETALFRLRRDLSGLIIRRRMGERERRYEHYMSQYSAQLLRQLARAGLGSDVVNPHDVPAARDAWSELGRRAEDAPAVLTLHGYFTREASSSRELREGSPAYERSMALEKGVYERADRIVCVDSRIRDYVLGMAEVPGERAAVLPNAVDTEAFRPATAEEKAEARRALGLEGPATVVLCPRRLVVKNGVDHAVRAAGLIGKEGKDIRLVLAGDGPERAGIEGLVRDLGLQGRVVMEGTVPHERIARFYAASDAVLIPSVSSAGVQEATSLSMLEGMAAGLPVVVTGIGGLKETVRHGGTGLVVPEADPGAIASAIGSLADDRAMADALGRAAREYVAAHHSHLAHARAMAGEYAKALR
ncbi:MAG: glycosyltransferase family 4 protein [Candidatus Thermoplasmatota archaeon]